VLVEFASAVDAVSCAVELQEAMGAANSEVPESRRIVLRIGISLGDVLVEGNDLYGDGVNVAARLEALTEAGRILVSHAVLEHVDHKLPVRFHDQGERTLKNISRPIRVYRVDWKAVPASPTLQLSPSQLELPDKTSIAVLPFINMSSDAEQEFFTDGLAEDLIS
jgi:class 3 adenylate cyclase